jgi:hypothetical protein
MRSTPVVTYLTEPLVRGLRLRANLKKVSLSRYLSHLVESDIGKTEAELTRAEILRRLHSAEDAGNCIVHDSLESLLKHVDRLADEID